MAPFTPTQIRTAIAVCEQYAPEAVPALAAALGAHDAKRAAYEPVARANERVRLAKDAANAWTFRMRMVDPVGWGRVASELDEARREASLALSLYRGKNPSP